MLKMSPITLYIGEKPFGCDACGKTFRGRRSLKVLAGKRPFVYSVFGLLRVEPEPSDATGYACEICSQIYTCQREFLCHYMRKCDAGFLCCRCESVFETTSELLAHHQAHKIEQIVIEPRRMQYEDEEEEEEEEEYLEEAEAVMNIPADTTHNSDLLYILDDSQCVNEVVIEETENHHHHQQKNSGAISDGGGTSSKPDNFSVVHVDHIYGYTMPSVFKGQLGSKKRHAKKKEAVDSDDPECNNLLEAMEASTSRKHASPKTRTIQQKRRHEIPDFSTPSYVILNPNDEVDMPHYKCLRCEQLFISKFVFFRHIEKGKCFVNSCDVCTAVFEKNSDFYDHYVAEHTDRAVCNFCFRTFMYEKNVKEHMLRHLDQFRHRCEECSKGFYTVREYRNHYKNRHMGIRHRCDECGRSFADEYYFKRHLAMHKRTVAAETL